jgi:putative oxidoreductase
MTMLDKFNDIFFKFTNHPDFGKLLLRVTFGVLMIFHGVAKINNGVGWIYDLLEAKGIPGFVAYGAFVGEIVAPVLMIIGFLTRPAAFVYAINILVATLLVATDKVFTITSVGAWGLEVQALYIVAGFCIMFLGPGKYSLSNK